MDRRVLPRPKSDRIILPMRSSQTGRVDGSEPFGHRRSQHAFIDEASHLGEQMVLLDHIRGLIEGAAEHKLPVYGHALLL